MTLFSLRELVGQLAGHTATLNDLKSRVDVAPHEVVEALLATTMFLAHVTMHILERDTRDAERLGYF